MNIVFIGMPGAGKGTQGRFFAQKLGMSHFSPGSIMWDEAAKKTPFGQEVHDYLSSGRLAPDWLVLRLLSDRLSAEKRGIIFGGFPRTLEQAEGMDAWLSSRSSELNTVIYLNIPEADAAGRLFMRALCTACGAVTAAGGGALPPCPSCGGNLRRREDDRPETVRKRFMVYKDQTESLLSYYRSNSVLKEVNAALPQQEVSAQIAMVLKSLV